MGTLSRLFCAAAAASLALAVHAQYPNRPLRIVMPFGPGGASDAVARVIAPALAARLGQPVLVENHPGAQGALAGQAAATAAADGYTLLYAVSATAALPIVTRTPYDMTRDFTPVSTLGTYDFGMFVSAKVPAANVSEFVAYAKAHRDSINYATLNLGEQYAAALFMQEAGLAMTQVPYRAWAQIVPDLISGQVQLTFGPLVNGLAMAKEGRLRVLATLGSERSAQTPAVPTMGEAGLTGVAFESMQMLFAPSKTPPEIVERLSQDVNAVLRDPEVRAQLEKLGLKPRGSTPQGMGKALADADKSWTSLSRAYRMGAE